MTTDRGHVTRVTIPLRHRDMDTLGHLNQSMYHVFLEEARAAILVELFEREQVEFVLAHVELDHRHEVRMKDGRVHAEAWIERFGRSSVGVGTRIVTDDGTVAAEGSTVLVAWDREARGARPLRDDEREALQGALGTAA
jgi:acyl-CoA thioester hydrolase